VNIGVENSTIDCNFDVDGLFPEMFVGSVIDFPDYHFRQYAVEGLSDDRDHTLFIYVTAVGNDDGLGYPNMHFDYMIVTQPVKATVVQGPNFYDDTDPAFVYSGPWSTGNGSMGDMNQTVHGSSSLNSSVELTFNGERVPALLSSSTSD
jgi:hypothetical protein